MASQRKGRQMIGSSYNKASKGSPYLHETSILVFIWTSILGFKQVIKLSEYNSIAALGILLL